MTIRIEIRTTAICEDCGYEWTPTMWTGVGNECQSLPLECPKCQEAKREAGRMIRHFDPVVNLLD